MSASQLVATLQGHQMVLSSEIHAITADITLLQQMNSRYAVQCGVVSLGAALEHLLRLRSEKELLLAQVNSQLRGMQEHVASSSALVQSLAMPSVTPSLIYPTTVLPAPAPSSASFIRAEGTHAVLAPTYSAPGVVHVHTPSGLVVTTNSAILANSPSRLR